MGFKFHGHWGWGYRGWRAEVNILWIHSFDADCWLEKWTVSAIILRRCVLKSRIWVSSVHVTTHNSVDMLREILVFILVCSSCPFYSCTKHSSGLISVSSFSSLSDLRLSLMYERGLQLRRPRQLFTTDRLRFSLDAGQNIKPNFLLMASRMCLFLIMVDKRSFNGRSRTMLEFQNFCKCSEMDLFVAVTLQTTKCVFCI